MTSLEKHLGRLQIRHPVVQRGAVEAIFGSLAERDTVATQAGRKALQTCLGHKDKVVVEAAVSKLCALTPAPGLTRAGALDMLLAALPIADGAAVGALVDGVMALVRSGIDEGMSGSWLQHPLSKALTAHPAAQLYLLAAVPRVLLTASKLKEERQRNSLLQALKPFLTFALLDPDPKGERAAFAPAIHAELVRLCTGGGPLRAFIVQLLLAHLRCYSLASPQRRTWVLSILQDVFEAVQAQQQAAGAKELDTLAATLVRLCAEIQGHGASIQQPLRVLRQAVMAQPGVLEPHMADLGALVTNAGARDSQELFALLALTAGQLQLKDSSTHLALTGMLVFPVVQTLAFDSSLAAKAWAGHLLSILGASKDAGTAPATRLQQPAANHSHSPQQEAYLLACDWHTEGGGARAKLWLQSLNTLLRSQPKASSVNGLPELLSPSMSMLLAAALSHHNADVQLAAVLCVVSAARAFPLMGISLLPLLIYQLQASTAGQQGKPDSRAAILQLALMSAVPELATHSAGIPLVTRFLSQLSAQGSPEVLQALALRLQFRLWQASGRNFPRLQTALLGYAAPGTKPGLALRASRAVCVRDVCAADPTKGTELVTAIQDALHDESDAVAALGMESVSLLCEADTLDFYAAWRVVQQHFPTPPSHRPLLAQQWVGLLGYGTLDARVFPERATAILDLLWLATADRVAKVRGEAYRALGKYSFEDMESLEALRPVGDFAQLLLDESNELARLACEELVAKALAHEHSIRRRHLSSEAKGGGRHRKAAALKGPTGALVQQLTKALPRELLSPDGHPANSSPGALLFLWAPPRPEPSADPKAAAQHAAQGYGKQFRSVLGRAPSILLGHHSLAIQSWRAFLGRWVAAEMTAQGQDTNSSQLAVRKVFSTVQQATRASGLANEHTVLASAVLCSLPGREDCDLAAEILQDALALLDQDRSARVSKSAALAVSIAAPSLHPTDKATREVAARQLLHQLAINPSGAVRAACAEAAGLLAASLATPPAKNAACGVTSANILGGLLRVAQVLKPDGGLGEAAVILPLPDWMADPRHGEPSEDEEAIVGIFAGIAHAAGTIATGEKSEAGSALLQALAGILGQPPASQNISVAKGVCIALPAVALAASQAGQSALTTSQLLDSLRALLVGHPHGSVRGAAAAAIGSLLAAPTAAHDRSPQSSPQALEDVWVPALCDALAAAQKLPGSAALAAGVLAGLAAVLGAVGVVPGNEKGSDGTLLTQKEAVATHRLALKALEAMAGKKGPPTSRATASWLLASACHGARRVLQQGLLEGTPGSAQGRQGVGAAAVPAAFRRGLDSLQPEGAMRPLVEFLINRHRGGMEQPNAGLHCASVLRCMAAAERLPSMPWAEICRDFLSKDNSAAAAALMLSIRHGSTSGSGLSELLDTLLELQRFATLAYPLQELLLRHLPEALAALSASRRLGCLQALATLSQRERGDSAGSKLGDSALHPARLQQAAWEGLTMLTQQSRGSADSLASGDVVFAAVRDLFQELPPAPIALLSQAGAQHSRGRLQHTQDHLLAAPDASPYHSAPNDPGQGAIVQLWAAAMACVGLLKHAQVVGLLDVDLLSHTAAAKAVAARCWLVRNGKLDAAELQVCRNFCIEASPAMAGPLMSDVASASISLPAAAQLQMLQVTLETMQVCDQPLQAQQMAAMFVAVWTAQQQGMPFEALVSARSPTAALAVFPSSLCSLLNHQKWQQATEVVAQRLVALQSISVGTYVDDALVALRNSLNSTHWQHISAAATRECVGLQPEPKHEAHMHSSETGQDPFFKE